MRCICCVTVMGLALQNLKILGFRFIEPHRLFGYTNMRAGPDVVKPLLDAWMVMKLRGIRPDVIHVHNYEAPLVAVLGKVLSRHI